MRFKEIIEGLNDKQVDKFHTELDKLVHKHLGHSSDEEEQTDEGRHDGNWTKDGVEMCSKECCGQPVTECTCGPDCPHCDCYEKNRAAIGEGERHGNSKIYDKCWDGYKRVPGKKRGEKGSCVKVSEYVSTTDSDEITIEDAEDIRGIIDETITEAEYQGRDVPLNKPMRGDVKKFKVYVKNPKGNVVKVNFGDPNMRIKKSNPERRKSFRARHNCDNPGPKHKARYWSCRKW